MPGTRAGQQTPPKWCFQRVLPLSHTARIFPAQAFPVPLRCSWLWSLSWASAVAAGPALPVGSGSAGGAPQLPYSTDPTAQAVSAVFSPCMGSGYGGRLLLCRLGLISECTSHMDERGTNISVGVTESLGVRNVARTPKQLGNVPGTGMRSPGAVLNGRMLRPARVFNLVTNPKMQILHQGE